MVGNWFNKANDPGLKIPLAYDAVNKQPSVTLLIMFLANILAITSLIYLHIFALPIVATTATCSYAITNTILYMIHKLNKAKIDLQHESFELDGTDNDKKNS